MNGRFQLKYIECGKTAMSVVDEGEIDKPSNKHEDVLNILKRNCGGDKLCRRCEYDVSMCSRWDVD